jgi:class 3 adenylate cyclase
LRSRWASCDPRRYRCSPCGAGTRCVQWPGETLSSKCRGCRVARLSWWAKTTDVIPETRYAKARDGTYIAYQAFGQGDDDILWIPGFATHLEVFWEHPPAARFLQRLAGSARVIWFDRRGTGLSDRVARLPDIETMLDDVATVLDAAGSKRAVLFGEAIDGGAPCAVYAASFPERVVAFIWWAATSRSAWAPDYPWGLSEEKWASDEPLIERNWGTEDGVVDIVGAIGGASIGDEPDTRRWWAKLHRYAATPAGAMALSRMAFGTDVRSVLPLIQVPTLLLSRSERPWFTYTASRIPGARLVQISEGDDPPWRGDQDELFAAIEEFLASVRREHDSFDRVLTTVMFTDIVGSASVASDLGDRRWAELVELHHALVRGLLARYRGQEVDTAGDGFFATFDGPARAIRCATAVAESVQRLGLEVRTGVHTGEVETIAGKVGGIAVMIGARIGAMAEPSEVLVSGTVRDLVAGSGLSFEPRGEYELKGVPDRWRLHRVVSEQDRS